MSDVSRQVCHCMILQIQYCKIQLYLYISLYLLMNDSLSLLWGSQGKPLQSWQKNILDFFPNNYLVMKCSISYQIIECWHVPESIQFTFFFISFMPKSLLKFLNPTLDGIQKYLLWTGVCRFSPPLLKASRGHFWGQME